MSVLLSKNNGLKWVDFADALAYVFSDVKNILLS
jgi:hypothetical protein